MSHLTLNKIEGGYAVFSPKSDSWLGRLRYDTYRGVWVFDPNADSSYSRSDLLEIINSIKFIEEGKYDE